MIQSIRVVRRADGAVEIVRILNQAELGQWRPDDPLAYEASLVWLYNPETLDFVRVAWLHGARTRRGPITVPDPAVTVGYACLASNAPPHHQFLGYSRRAFYLLPEDFFRDLIDHPAGAIDPTTIQPGHPGQPPNCERIRPTYLSKARPTARPTSSNEALHISPDTASRQQ